VEENSSWVKYKEMYRRLDGEAFGVKGTYLLDRYAKGQRTLCTISMMFCEETNKIATRLNWTELD